MKLLRQYIVGIAVLPLFLLGMLLLAPLLIANMEAAEKGMRRMDKWFAWLAGREAQL